LTSRLGASCFALPCPHADKYCPEVARIGLHYGGSFDVATKKEDVFDFVVDPAKVTTIFPDVEDVKVIDDSKASLKARVGISFIRGIMDMKLEIVEKTRPTFTKVIARGTGMSSSVDLTGTFTLEDAEGGGTRLKWTVDATVGGLIAGAGSRLIDSAAYRYTKQIVDSLQSKLS
jgi:carbon monoxide dehydrogenase subunit G